MTFDDVKLIVLRQELKSWNVLGQVDDVVDQLIQVHHRRQLMRMIRLLRLVVTSMRMALVAAVDKWYGQPR